MAKVGKRFKNAREGIDPKVLYPVTEAVKMIKERATAKFDETIEISINLGVDPRHSDQMVRGVVALPAGTGRTVRVAVFARDAKADEAREAGADIVGAEDLAAQIQKGELNFDRCIATPDMMVTFMAWCTTEDLKPHPFSGFTILAEHMRPQSRGFVRLKGQGTAIDPAIQFNFFENEADHRAAIAGLRLGRKISETRPMADCVAREISPGLDVNSEAEMIAYCRQNGLSLLHPVGTCAMGNGPDAVVDTDLKVHGISGLRVIDASIMPRIVTANTNAAAIMIGEKGVAHILRDVNV